MPVDVWRQPSGPIELFPMNTPTLKQIKSPICLISNNRSDVDSQTSPIKGTSLQEFGPDTEPFPENRTRNTPVQCLNDSQEKRPQIQEIKTDMTTNYSGDGNVPLNKITTSRTEERRVRDGIAKELYKSL